MAFMADAIWGDKLELARTGVYTSVVTPVHDT